MAAWRQEADIGLSKSTQTTGPSKQALPYLNAASGAIQGAYDSNQGNLADISSGLRQGFDQFGANMQNDPVLGAARGYVTDTLGSPYGANPELQSQINLTNDSVTDRVNALFSRAGQTGSSRQVGELGKQLSANESNLRYTDWNNDQQRRAAAVQSALGLGQLGNQTAATYAGLGESAATTPYLGANMLASGLGGLWGNSQTTTGSPNIGQQFLGAGAQLGSAAIMAGSERRIKTNIVKVGELEDGLGWYSFEYLDPERWGAGPQLGTMVDEVERLRPWALGPVTHDGIRTVNYAELERA